MAKEKTSVAPRSTSDSTRGGDAEPPPGFRHHGLGHLRRVMRLSDGVESERVCEEAALEIERLRSRG